MKRVLSGIRATGRLHLGNYLGAVKGMLALQADPEYQTLYMVADAHTLTTPYKVDELKINRREVIIDYLAAGLDPQKSILFVQSDVTEHFELAFYFSSMVSIARMQHLPTFKDKVKQHPGHATMALLNYPVLMAADILVYKAGHVPVGIDQEPHLEIAREIARKFNHQYQSDFPEPIRFATEGEYVPSLMGEGKMSKSVEGSYINLTDDRDTILKKVAKIPTDSGQGVYSQASSGVKSLFQLIKLFQGENYLADVQKQYEGDGLRYASVKEALAEAMFKELEPIQLKRQELLEDPAYIDQVISLGAQKASQIAGQTLSDVKAALGLKS